MTEHQASRAEPGGGMAAVERDVIEVPRDKDAKRLVKAILEQSRLVPEEIIWSAANQERLALSLGIIQGDAERLAELLAERDAEREELVTALEKADDALAQAGWGPVSRPRAGMRVALARVKEAS